MGKDKKICDKNAAKEKNNHQDSADDTYFGNWNDNNDNNDNDHSSYFDYLDEI